MSGNNLAVASTGTHNVIVLNHIASDQARVPELCSSKRKRIFSLWNFSCCSFSVYIFAHDLLQNQDRCINKCHLRVPRLPPHFCLCLLVFFFLG